MFLTNASSFCAAALLLICGMQPALSQSSSPSDSLRQLLRDKILDLPSSTIVSSFSTTRVTLSDLSATKMSEASALLFSALERYGMTSRARSVQIVDFSLERMMILTEPGARVELFGVPVRLVHHEMRETPTRVDYFGFQREETDEPLYLAADISRGSVTGYGLLNGRSYEIRPLNDQDHPRHLLIEIPQFAPDRKGMPIDSGDPGAADRASSAKEISNATPIIQPSVECDSSHRKLELTVPLTIAFGFTQDADVYARRRGISIRDHMQTSADALHDALAAAGITVKVELVGDGLEINYREPSLDGGQVLWTEVKATTDGADPELAKLRQYRKDRGGDIQVLLVNHDDDDNCGWARDVGVNAAHASVVVSFHCLTRKFSVEHEILHLLGAYHDDEKIPKPYYARAFIYDPPIKLANEKDSVGPFVTLTGKDIDCATKGTCVRILKLSDPFATNLGIVIGEPGVRDNACSVRQHLPAATVFGAAL